MKILLDECIPKKFKNQLRGHECQTVPDAGWAGKKNGELLSLAEKSGFEVLITIDRGFIAQQSVSDRRIAVILMRVRSSRLADLIPYAPKLLGIVESIRLGDLIRVP